MKQLVKQNLGITIALTVLFVSSSLLAQPQNGAQGRQQGPKIPSPKEITKMVDDLSKELSLNDEQETKISEMYITHFDEVKEATKSGRPDRNKMEALKNDFEKDVKSVLTKDQQKQFAKYQKKQSRGQGRERPKE